MTARLRGWLLPPAALCFALGVLLGRIAASPWTGALALLPAAGAVFLLRGKKRFCAVLSLFLALGCLRGYQAYHPSLPEPGSFVVSGIVSEEIQARSNGQFRTALANVTLDGRALPGGRAYWSFYADELPAGLTPGIQVSFQGRVYHPSGASNPGGYDFREELLRRGIRAGIYGSADLNVSPPAFFSPAGRIAALRHALRLRLLAALGEETGEYASAMLLGTRSFLPREDRLAFSRLGVAHLLSVSGFHTGVLMALLGLLFRWLRLPRKLRLFLFSAVLFLYAALCGWSQPVLRASLLVLLAEAGRILNRPRLLTHLLSAAFLILLFFSPVQLTGLSFLLSFGAVAGLALVTPFLSALLSPSGALSRRLWRGLSAGLGAQIGILLPQLSAFQELPLLGLLANLPMMALGSWLIGLYWAVLLTLPFPALSSLCCRAAGICTAGFLAAVRSVGALPGITLWTKAAGPLTGLGVVLLTAGLCGLLRLRGRSRLLLSGAGVLLTVLSLLPGSHLATEYIQFSVGSADAAVLWDQNRLYVLDAGYEDGVLSSFLRRGRLTPDAVILTHLHSDHVYGLQAMMEDRIPIPLIYLPDGAEAADIHPSAMELLEKLKAGGTEIRTLAAGDTLDLPSGNIRVLWPEKGRTRPGQDANQSSLVLRLDLKGSVLLQTGDLDGRYEMYAAAPADVLKVAHHGSLSSSSPAFLAAVHPSAALLTCDDAQRHLQFQDRLGDIPLFSTALHGMLTVRFEENAFTVETYLTPSETDFVSESNEQS